MRKIPVTINADFSKIVGWLELDDTISDDELPDMFVAWVGESHRGKVTMMSLVPMQSQPYIPRR